MFGLEDKSVDIFELHREWRKACRETAKAHGEKVADVMERETFARYVKEVTGEDVNERKVAFEMRYQAGKARDEGLDKVILAARYGIEAEITSQLRELQSIAEQLGLVTDEALWNWMERAMVQVARTASQAGLDVHQTRLLSGLVR